jgi:hypothetical protein
VFIEQDFEKLNQLRTQSERFGHCFGKAIVEWWLVQLQKDKSICDAILAAAEPVT